MTSTPVSMKATNSLKSLSQSHTCDSLVDEHPGGVIVCAGFKVAIHAEDALEKLGVFLT